MTTGADIHVSNFPPSLSTELLLEEPAVYRPTLRGHVASTHTIVYPAEHEKKTQPSQIE